jgi:hypothetical protein
VRRHEHGIRLAGLQCLVCGWLVLGLAVSALLFVRAMPHSPLRSPSPQAMPASVATTTFPAKEAAANVGTSTARTETVYGRKLITQPIETIRVGQRVLGTNPNQDEVEPFEEPDPQTWRTIEVEQIKPSGKRLYATLLRPLEWIEEELDPQTNTIDLDLAELGAEGPAKVLRIGPCPPIAAGAGHIVTATFQHEPDGELLTLTIGDDDIGCTANHPFWSEDRQEFVEAGQLRQGERVRTRLEQVASVVSIKPRPPTAWVYNLEVQGEHVYEVGPGGVLVHNVCRLDLVRMNRVKELADKGDRIFKLKESEKQFIEEVFKRKNGLQVYRSNQKEFIGDFVIIDRSNPKKPMAFVLELTTKGGSGNKLKNWPEIQKIFPKLTHVEHKAGTAEELLELISRGRRAFP